MATKIVTNVDIDDETIKVVLDKLTAAIKGGSVSGLSLNGTTLTLSQTEGGDVSVDLSSLKSSDGGAVAGSELTNAALNGTTLTLTLSTGKTFDVDLSSLKSTGGTSSAIELKEINWGNGLTASYGDMVTLTKDNTSITFGPSKAYTIGDTDKVVFDFGCVRNLVKDNWDGISAYYTVDVQNAMSVSFSAEQMKKIITEESGVDVTISQAVIGALSSVQQKVGANVDIYLIGSKGTEYKPEVNLSTLSLKIYFHELVTANEVTAGHVADYKIVLSLPDCGLVRTFTGAITTTE